MREPHSPRRYVVDIDGRRVIVGLTREETAEFEGLDNSLPLRLDERAENLASRGIASADEGRWLELYDKHDRAWARWITDLRAEQGRNSLFFN